MIQARNSEPAEQAVTEPLSPELALVDPELATLARKRLRAFDERSSSATREVARDQRAGAPAARHASEHVARELDPSARLSDDLDSDAPVARGRRGGLILGTAALALIAAAAAVVSIRLQDVDEAGGSLAPTTRTVPPLGAVEAPKNQRPSEPSGARPGTTSPRSTKPVVQQEKRLRPPRPAAIRTRVFVWPAVLGATFYRVEFFRRGRKIFEASPTTPRIELPLRWLYRGRRVRLTAGTYRWDVRPAFGPRSRPRYGTLITRSSWTAR